MSLESVRDLSHQIWLKHNTFDNKGEQHIYNFENRILTGFR